MRISRSRILSASAGCLSRPKVSASCKTDAILGDFSAEFVWMAASTNRSAAKSIAHHKHSAPVLRFKADVPPPGFEGVVSAPQAQ